MKSPIIKLTILFYFCLHFSSGFGQLENNIRYKFVNERLEGFLITDFESLPENVRVAMKKALKRNLFEEEDTIVYSVNEANKYCVRFLQKYYEATFIVFNSAGKKLQTIVFINPEYEEFGKIYNQISDSHYELPPIDSPYGPMRKIITPTKAWFEVFMGKQAGEEFETVLIFDEHFKQIAIEKN
jgi:hypothetical protein